MNKKLLETIGLSGMAMVLLAYFLATGNYAGFGTFVYQSLNAAGSALLCFYGIKLKSLTMIVFNSIWILIAIYNVFKIAHWL